MSNSVSREKLMEGKAMVWTITISMDRRGVRKQIVSTDLRTIRECIDDFAGRDYPGCDQAFTARHRNDLCKNGLTSFSFDDKKFEVKLL